MLSRCWFHSKLYYHNSTFFVEKHKPFTIFFYEVCYLSTGGNFIWWWFLGAFKLSSSVNFITFYERIFLKLRFYFTAFGAYSSINCFEAKQTIFLLLSPCLAFGSFAFKFFNTLGHLIVSIILISPPITSSNSYEILWKMLLSRS